MTEGMAQGKKAAIAIHNALRNATLKDEKWAEKPAVPDIAAPRITLIKKEQKQDMPTMPSDKRLDNFEEVELGFSLNTAVKEAQRCMNCGAGAFVDDNLCVGCLTCVRVCPFEVPKIKKGTQQPTLMEIVNPVVYALWNVLQRRLALKLLWKTAVKIPLRQFSRKNLSRV